MNLSESADGIVIDEEVFFLDEFKKRGINLAELNKFLVGKHYGVDFFLQQGLNKIISEQARNVRVELLRVLDMPIPCCYPIAMPDNFLEVVTLWENGEITIAEALEQTGLKQATFFKRLKEYRVRMKHN